MIKSSINLGALCLTFIFNIRFRRYSLVRLHNLLTLVLISLISTVIMAGERFDVRGGFGFDWYKPIQATCKKMTANSTQTLTQCAFKDSGAFGLPLSYYACPLKGKGEVLVFKNKKQCQEAIETMRANGP